jgi:hypothetical protein
MSDQNLTFILRYLTILQKNRSIKPYAVSKEMSDYFFKSYLKLKRLS